MKKVTPIILLLAVSLLSACASNKSRIPGAPHMDAQDSGRLAPGELPGDKSIKNSEVAYNMALEFAGQSNMEAAKHYIDLAIKLQPDSKYSYTKGLFYLSERRYQDALGYFAQSLQQGPGTTENRLAVLNAEGVCYKELGKDEEALEVFRQVVNTPGMFSRFESYYNMGVIYMRQNKTLDAEAVFLKVVDENPGYYRAYNKLGLLAGGKQDWGGAALYFKKALDIMNNDYNALQADGAEVYYNYGEALFHEKLYPQSREALLQVLKTSPESPYGKRAKEILSQIGGGDAR